MLVRLTLVSVLLYVQYSSAKKYEEIAQEVIGKVKAAKTSWQADVSGFFKGKNEDELKGYLGYKKPAKRVHPTADAKKPSAKQKGRKEPKGRLAKRATSLPASFDWRHYTNCASVSDIRTQRCGDCWAVSSAAVISDRYCLYTQTDKFFSAKQVTTCSVPTDPDTGCEGGDPNNAMSLYLISGVTTGGDPTLTTQDAGCLRYPIAWTVPTKCPTKCDDGSTPKVNKADSWGEITSKNVNEIMQEIYDFGPVVGAFDVYKDFYYYKTGVYQHTYGTLEGGHAVRIIGWGVADDGTPYWLCLNQWGTDFGEDGAFKILRGKDHLGIEDWITFAYPIESNA